MPPKPPSIASLQQAIEQADWGRVFDARRMGISWNMLRTRAGLTALGMALLQDSADIVKQLLVLGAPTGEIPLKDGNVLSPLGIAMAQENPELVHLLLEAGADPNEPDPADALASPPLITAARRGWGPVVECLLKCGARPNATDNQGQTAWHHLAHHLAHAPDEAMATVAAMKALILAGGRADPRSLETIHGTIRAHSEPKMREAGAELLELGQQAQAFRDALHLGQAIPVSSSIAHEPRL